MTLGMTKINSYIFFKPPLSEEMMLNLTTNCDLVILENQSELLNYLYHRWYNWNIPYSEVPKSKISSPEHEYNGFEHGLLRQELPQLLIGISEKDMTIIRYIIFIREGGKVKM